MTREKMIDYIIQRLRRADTEVLTVIYTLLLHRENNGCVPEAKDANEK